MRGSAAFRVSVAPGGGLAPSWVRDSLSRNAGASPSLDLRFADSKSLVDSSTGANLVTFTRASSGTYVGSDGLIKTATTNLLPRSEEIGTSPWGTNAPGAVTYTANAIAAPTGANTADRVTATADFAGPNQFVSVISSLSYSLSFYVKAVTPGSLDSIRIECFSGRFAAFNISTRVFSGVNAAITPSSVSLGDGWVRVQCLFTAPSTGSLAVAIYANTSSDFYLWGAQLEQSSTVGEYIPTTSTINSAPRFDHNPTTGESLGLLVEEQRTNEVRNSNSMSAVVTGSPGTLPTNWSAQGNANGWTREVVGSGSLGSLNYVDIRFSGTPTGGQFSVTFQPQGVVAASNGQTWAASVYYQLVGGSLGNVVGYPAANLWSSTPSYLSGLGLAGSIIPSATLQRYTGSGTISQASTAFISWGITFVCTAGNTYDFTIRFSGPQLELGAFSTSFVPTTGTAATRSADVASITGANFSSWYNQTEGTVFANAVISGASTETGIVGLTNAGETDFLRVSRLQTTSRPRSLVFDDSAAQADTQPTNTISAGQAFKLATVLKQNDFSTVLDGGSAAVDTSGTMPTVDRMTIGTGAFLTQLNGTIRRLTYFPIRLPNATLQQITR